MDRGTLLLIALALLSAASALLGVVGVVLVKRDKQTSAPGTGTPEPAGGGRTETGREGSAEEAS